MTRAELKEIHKRENMEILRHPITKEAWGLRLETKKDIPELDELVKTENCPVIATKEYGAYYETNGIRVYTVHCPKNWFDLYGWVDD